MPAAWVRPGPRLPAQPAPARSLRPGLLWHFPRLLTCPLNKRQLAVALCACPLLPWAGCGAL